MSDKKNDGSVEFKKLPVVPNKINKNDLMAFVYYGTVVDKQNKGESLKIKFIGKPDTFDVTGVELIQNSFSADQFTEEIVVNQTECIDRLMVSYNRPFTVCWDTKDRIDRVLRGVLVSSDGKRGYSLVKDLDIGGLSQTGFREVDHRSLHWLIVDGIKFVVGRK